MKLIIAGSRDLNVSTNFIHEVYTMLFEYTPNNEIEIVNGGANGIDACARQFAREFGDLTCITINADWNEYGKAAGPIRNRDMAKYADQLLLIWDGKSRGSANMKLEMEKLGKPIKEVIIK